MRRAPTFFLATVLQLLQAGTASAIDIEQIRPDAWAATQPEARMFNDCNSLIVEADEFLIVVDAQESRDDVHRIITVPGHGPTLHDDLLISKLLTYFNALKRCLSLRGTNWFLSFT